MGNISMPNSLSELAKYCDCLETTERFKHQPDPSEKSEQEPQRQKQETPKKQQPRRMPQQNIQQAFYAEPPQVKINKPSAPQAAIKRRSNMRIKENQHSRPQIDDISDISNELEPQNQTNDLEIVQIDKDEDIRANDLKKFYNPLFRTANDFKPQKTGPLIKTDLEAEHDQFDIDNIEISEINEPPSHDYQHPFFLNKQDKEEYQGKNHSSLAKNIE